MTEPAPPSDPAAGTEPLDPADFVEDRVAEDAARVTDSARWRARPPLQWPLMVVLGGLVTSLIIVAGDHFRRGSVLFALFVGLAFVLRLFLPEQEAGWLAVRSRRVDLLVLGGLAGALLVFSLIVPSPS